METRGEVGEVREMNDDLNESEIYVDGEMAVESLNGKKMFWFVRYPERLKRYIR